ncbi:MULTISPECIES: hypothetical protein [unclassified Microcoleus]|nr:MULTISPECIES: hypothetical protein [unclassified Microcoleus]MCC3435603.1 hypothetical protein [Microcoleus sp. PH2017_05_CCC_O_A]
MLPLFPFVTFNFIVLPIASIWKSPIAILTLKSEDSSLSSPTGDRTRQV